jgi:hypothetical protein
MKAFSNTRAQIGSVIRFALLLAVLAICAGRPASAAQPLPLACSWPVESTGSGNSNVAYPDADATYWLMAVDTNRWKAMVVTGQYPRSRFFSFATYLEGGGVVDSMVDANIAADAGSGNPFAPGASGEARNYTLTIDGNAGASGNHIRWGSTPVAYVIYRIYVADRGLSRMGGLALPGVALVGADGTAHPIAACPSGSIAGGLRDLITALEGRLASLAPAPCPTGASQQHVVTFATSPNSGGSLFPNPANTYVAARGLCYEPGRVIVVRGKAAVFPDTYNGASIFQAAIEGDIQMRYWSLCNNEQRFPFPVVACQPDHSTRLDDQGFYTYVVSPDESGTTPPTPPSWVPADATWLPWGERGIANDLLFREMLPVTNFLLTGDYYPEGVLCDQQVFAMQGWRACFAAAGVTTP